ASLVLAIIFVTFAFGFFALVRPGVSPFQMQGPMAVIAVLVLFVGNNFIIFSIWSGIYFGVAYLKRQRRLEIESYQAQTALAEAELRGLKSQLNPHFLFNSLNSLRALVVENPPHAQQAITELAAIFRYQLKSGERSLVPLRDELETVEQYLALEVIRFEDRLVVESEIDPNALPLLIPPFALQTLVENAVKYGVSREAGAGRIRLAAALRDERLEISVGNNGTLRGSSGDSTGVGLTNLRTRLRLLFADRASLDLREEPPDWVEARLVLPAERA
ncbi:MAG TPA: histidine kinase, partial [Chthoniobacterales bacterium]|nr:histidine kinase [Chthoniobacterales bacterium]